MLETLNTLSPSPTSRQVTLKIVEERFDGCRPLVRKERDMTELEAITWKEMFSNLTTDDKLRRQMLFAALTARTDWLMENINKLDVSDEIKQEVESKMRVRDKALCLSPDVKNINVVSVSKPKSA